MPARLPSAVDGVQPAIETVWAHTPTLYSSFFRMFGAIWKRKPENLIYLELIRVRTMRKAGCPVCKQMRFTVGGERIMDEAATRLVDDDYGDSELPDQYKLFLSFIDAVMFDPRKVPEHLSAELIRQFGEEDMILFTVYTGIATGFAKLIAGMDFDVPAETMNLDLELILQSAEVWSSGGTTGLIETGEREGMRPAGQGLAVDAR